MLISLFPMSAAMIYINHDIGQSLKNQALIDRSIAQLRQYGMVGVSWVGRTIVPPSTRFSNLTRRKIPGK